MKHRRNCLEENIFDGSSAYPSFRSFYVDVRRLTKPLIRPQRSIQFLSFFLFPNFQGIDEKLPSFFRLFGCRDITQFILMFSLQKLSGRRSG